MKYIFLLFSKYLGRFRSQIMNPELKAPPVGGNTNFKKNLEINVTVTGEWQKIISNFYFIVGIIFK